MKSQYLFVVVQLFLLKSFFFSEAEARVPWEPIENMNDPKLIEIANFAVNEHNRVAHSHLEFQRVVSGEKKLSSFGLLAKYRVVLVTFDNSRNSIDPQEPDARTVKYEARVNESALGIKTLKWFRRWSG